MAYVTIKMLISGKRSVRRPKPAHARDGEDRGQDHHRSHADRRKCHGGGPQISTPEGGYCEAEHSRLARDLLQAHYAPADHRRLGVVEAIQGADSHRPLAALCLNVHRVKLILDVLLLPEESECVPCLLGESSRGGHQRLHETGTEQEPPWRSWTKRMPGPVQGVGIPATPIITHPPDTKRLRHVQPQK